jgi:3-hydroxybutyrate dehydrogenase
VNPKGRCVLITGCDTGFGFNAAKKLYGLGFTVFATVISKDTDGAKALEKEFKERMFVIPMNVTSDKDVIKGLEFVKENLPKGSRGKKKRKELERVDF